MKIAVGARLLPPEFVAFPLRQANWVATQRARSIRGDRRGTGSSGLDPLLNGLRGMCSALFRHVCVARPMKTLDQHG